MKFSCKQIPPTVHKTLLQWPLKLQTQGSLNSRNAGMKVFFPGLTQVPSACRRYTGFFFLSNCVFSRELWSHWLERFCGVPTLRFFFFNPIVQIMLSKFIGKYRINVFSLISSLQFQEVLYNTFLKILFYCLTALQIEKLRHWLSIS